jgi:hypothetical protein
MQVVVFIATTLYYTLKTVEQKVIVSTAMALYFKEDGNFIISAVEKT